MYQGNPVFADEISEENEPDVRALSRIQRYDWDWAQKFGKIACHECGGLMRYKHGGHNAPHFAHIEEQDCRVYRKEKSETKAHMEAKNFLRRLLRHTKQFDFIDAEVPCPSGRVFDLYFERKYTEGSQITLFGESTKVGIEVQRCRLDGDYLGQGSLRERLELGSQDNVYTLMILVPGPHYKATPLVTQYRPVALEREICDLNRGIVYYCNGLNEELFSLHFGNDETEVSRQVHPM